MSTPNVRVDVRHMRLLPIESRGRGHRTLLRRQVLHDRLRRIIVVVVGAGGRRLRRCRCLRRRRRKWWGRRGRRIRPIVARDEEEVPARGAHGALRSHQAARGEPRGPSQLQRSVVRRQSLPRRIILRRRRHPQLRQP